VHRAIITVQGWYAGALSKFDAIGFDDLVDSALGVSRKSLVQNRPAPGLTLASPTGTQFKKNGLA